MSSHISITVILCTWNRAELLRVTLDSLRGQLGCESLDIDIIVVDNNSSDATQNVVEKAAADWSLGTLRYAFEPRQGKQFALNTGIRLARSTVLAFSDDDVTFSPNWLRCIAQIFQDERIDLVGGKTLVLWPESGQPGWFDARMAAIVGGVNLGERQIDPSPVDYAPAGANLIARSQLFDQIGLFAESHFRHMDYEFGMRCRRAGAHVTYDPALVVHTPVAAEILTKRYFRRWSFKAGIGHTSESNLNLATLFGVPRWIYRQIAADVIYLALHFLQSGKPEFFYRELRIWRHIGTVTSCWLAQLTPRRYAEWVERYSQKKGNLY
ncbi:glycosyltransferase family 2 protein [Chromatium okenii]|uniref:glycosyltransferase n=1 Tax=Chromatium okenii TaxID=61644 RepID=UPI0026EC59C9|nr:glycosyltransferase [Chromatium okenii]MBV5310464.1 glycosyltransferase family 2 protein [Chromatium okenii]